MFLSHHPWGFLAVVIGHLQIFLFEPLSNQIKRHTFDLYSIGGKGMAEQMRFNRDRFAIASCQDHAMQQKAQTGRDRNPILMLGGILKEVRGWLEPMASDIRRRKMTLRKGFSWEQGV